MTSLVNGFNTGFRALTITLVALLSMNAAAVAQSKNARPNRKAPRSGAEFSRAMNNRTQVLWSERPLDQALSSVRRTNQIAIWLDRRVDPGQELTLNANNLSISDLLESLARHINCRVAQVGSTVMIGPAGSTDKLATVLEIRRDQLKQAPQESRNRLLRKVAWKWDALTTPTELLERLEAEAQVTIEGKSSIPHDLWAGQQLPPTTWMDRLGLVLIGFDRTFEFVSANKVRIIPLPTAPTITRIYKFQLTQESLARLRGLYPKATFERVAKTTRVVGPIEVHRKVLGGVDPKKTGKKGRPGTRQVLDLKVESTAVGTILKSLQAQQGLEIRLTESAGKKLTFRVTFDAKKASLDQLLHLTLDPAGLKFKLSGKQLDIDVK